MVTLRPGSQTAKLLTFLSFAGEFPVRSVRLLGSDITLRRLINKLSQPQDFRLDGTSEIFHCRLLNVDGKGKYKSVRLSKAALPILEKTDPDGYRYYLKNFKAGNRSGKDLNVERKHRMAEPLAMCLTSGIRVCPYRLPQLKSGCLRNVVTDGASYYEAKAIKSIGEDEANKLRFSRITGAIFYPGGGYAVYNSRDTLMKWNGKGEAKARLGLEEIGAQNAEVEDIPAAILFGSDYELAMRTIEQLSGKEQKDYQYDGIYSNMHFIPLNHFGSKLLSIITTPDWNERLLQLLFPENIRSRMTTNVEHDAFSGGTYLYSFLDSDILRLNRFRDGLKNTRDPVTIFCFPEQAEFLSAFFGNRVSIKQIRISAIEAKLLQKSEESK